MAAKPKKTTPTVKLNLQTKALLVEMAEVTDIGLKELVHQAVLMLSEWDGFSAWVDEQKREEEGEDLAAKWRARYTA